MLLCNCRIHFLGFGLLGRSKFSNGIALGFWILAKRLSCAGCAGCCTLIFSSLLLDLGKYDVIGTWFV
jgi:hypothetical protein